MSETLPTSTPPAAAAETVEQAGLVLLGLQPADHPGAGVGQRLVVDVDRVLGGEDEPDAEGPGLLEQREDRLLGGRRAVGRHVAHDLVEVDEHPQLVGAGLASHPGDQLGEHERDDELALLVGQVGEAHDGARPACRRARSRRRCRGRVPCAQAANAGDASSPLSRMASLVRSSGGKKASSSNTPSLRSGGRLDLADEAWAGRGPGPRPRPWRPGSRAGCAPGWRAGRPRCPTRPSRPDTKPSTSSAITSASVPSGGRRSPPTTLSGTPRRRARRVDGQLGGVAQGLDAGRSMPQPASPSFQLLGHLGRVVALDPRCERLGVELGEGEQQVGEVALGIEDQRGDASRRASSSSTTPRPVLPDPVMPTMTPCVVRSAASSSTASPLRSWLDGSIASPR